MILIEKPYPSRCMNCPCSYWLRSGKYNGRLMCEALVRRREDQALRENGMRRPDDCPVRLQEE